MEGLRNEKEPAIDAEASSSVPDIKSMFSNARRKVKPSTVPILPPPPPPPAPKVEEAGKDQKDDGWEREYQKLEKYLNEHELTIRKVDSDGSCLFSSFAVHIPGTTPETLRKEAVDFMLSHENDFAPFIDCEAYPNGFDDYCRRMRSSATWGSQLEIQALSQSRNVNVFIFQTDGKATIKMINFDDPSTQCITVSYHDGEHYNSVVPIQDRASDSITVTELERLLAPESDAKSYVDNDSSKVSRTRRKAGLFN